MKVSELIALLQKCDQDAPVLSWDTSSDWWDEEVHVNVEKDGKVLIANVGFGDEVLP